MHGKIGESPFVNCQLPHWQHIWKGHDHWFHDLLGGIDQVRLASIVDTTGVDQTELGGGFGVGGKCGRVDMQNQTLAIGSKPST